MEEATFYMWFSKMFVPYAVQLRKTNELQGQTAILFFDGHSSHISIRIIQSAISENIKLVKFPSHLTDKIQPLDVSVFGPIKTTWEQHLVEHGKTHGNPRGSGRCCQYVSRRSSEHFLRRATRFIDEESRRC